MENPVAPLELTLKVQSHGGHLTRNPVAPLELTLKVQSHGHTNFEHIL